MSLLTHFISCTSLPLADSEGFWVFVGLGFALWGVFSLVARTAEGHRSHVAMTERKRCRHCQTDHPGFAGYCRQCGRRF